MIRFKYTFSARVKEFLKEPGGILRRYMTALANELYAEWSKEAGSTRYWRGGKHAMRHPAPLPSKLTERSGRLRMAALGKGPYSLKNIKVTASSFTVSKGGTLPYFYYQEYLKGGVRSFIRRALEYIRKNRMDYIVRKAKKRLWR